jgi:peptidoglycan/LPS O-acetylase OafA/YrhL
VPFFCAGGALYFALRGSVTNMAIFAASTALSLIATWTAVAEAGSRALTVAIFSCFICSLVCLALRSTSHAATDRFLGDLSYPVYVGHWLPLLVFTNVMHLTVNDMSLFMKVGATIAGLLLPIIYFISIEPLVQRFRTSIRGIAVR